MPILPAILPRPFELRYKTSTSNFQPGFSVPMYKAHVKALLYIHIYIYIYMGAQRTVQKDQKAESSW